MNGDNKVNGIAQDGEGNRVDGASAAGGRAGGEVESPGPAAPSAPVKSRAVSGPSSAGIRGLIGRDPQSFTPEQKLLLLDVWEKSTLTGIDFSSIVGVEPATLYLWRKLYQQHGPEGLYRRWPGSTRAFPGPRCTSRRGNSWPGSGRNTRRPSAC